MRRNLDFFVNSDVLLIHADNYTNLDLIDFLNSFYSRNEHCIISMVTFITSNPEECGVVKTNDEGVLEEYYEEDNPPSNIANGALFAFNEDFLKFFISLPPTENDFCADIVTKLKTKYKHISQLFIDIGTPSSLN